VELKEPSAAYALRTRSTEIGDIPGDWAICSIGEIASSSSGTTPPRSQFDRYYAQGSHAWVKTLDLTNGEVYSTDEAVTDLALQETNLRLYPAGSVLVAMYGGLRQIGRTGLLRTPAAVNQAITAIQPADGRLVPEYLLAVLNYRVDDWKSVASSSRKDPNITGADVRSFKVAMPPLDEQSAIAQAVADADALIDSLEQLLAKKRQTKQGAMQELLTGKRRLPTFSGDWKECVLGNLLESRPDYGINAPAVPYSSSLPTYLRITDIDGEGRLLADARVSVDRPDAEFYYLIPGDVVFARTGASVGKSYLYKQSDGPLVFAGFLIRVRPCETKLVPSFLFYFSQTRRYWKWVTLMSMRSGQPGINGRELSSMPILLPGLAEQQAIAQILSDMDADIYALEARLAKARDLKQAMMQVLLTGRIRFKGEAAG
jgi:type I restriction enzyme S subunit